MDRGVLVTGPTPLDDPTEQANKTALAAAIQAGHQTYKRGVVLSYRDACSTCGHAISTRFSGRFCACPGVTWKFTSLPDQPLERVETQMPEERGKR
jgi:hypothetical protein